MRLPGEEESGGMGPSVIYMVIGVSAFVLIILFAVFQNNNHKSSGSAYLKEVQQQQEEEAALELVEEQQQEEAAPKLRAEDLDFWDMYPVDGQEAGTAGEADNSQTEKTGGKSS